MIDGAALREDTFAPARARNLALVFVSAVLFLLTLVRIMNFDVRKDEQLYVPPARLLGEMSLYRDFFYNHPPASAWYFHALDALTGSNHLLLSGRIGIALAWIFFAGALGAVTFAFTRSLTATWSIAVLTLFNDLFLGQTGMAATNNFIPWAVAYAGISLFVISIGGPGPRPFLTAGAGGLAGLAVSVKISAVAFIPAMVIAACFFPRRLALRQRLSYVVAPLAAGGVIGGSPIVISLLTQPQLFLAHIVRYHSGPHLQYYRSGLSGESPAMTLADKAGLAWQVLLSPSLAVALTAAAVLAALGSGAVGRAAPQIEWRAPMLVVLAAAIAISVPMCFVQTPSFPQYYAPPIICLPLVLVFFYAGLAPAQQQTARSVLLVCAAVVVFVNLPRLMPSLPALLHPKQWTVFSVRDGGNRIADELMRAGAPAGPVATLAPIYPIEGNLNVYPELATGPFAYRTGDITDPALSRYYRMTSPATVAGLFDRVTPAAFLLGSDARLEASLFAYAAGHGYRMVEGFEIRDRQGSLRLYVKSGP